LYVIVGATSPIARAYAADCAFAGKPLMLAGRDLAELELIAADLRIRHRVQVTVQSYDAAVPGEGRKLAQTLAGSYVGAVVAFHGIMGDRDDFPAMLQVNCASIAELFEVVAGQSLQAGGKPVLAAVSSVAGDRGRQSNYPYGASKAALDVYRHITTVADKYLPGANIEFLGHVMFDENVSLAIIERKLLVESRPDSAAAQCVASIVERLVEEAGTRPLTGNMQFFWKRLLQPEAAV
jgi:NAD(P)-dependent dehydrogenase (short-subunit alcohol dehydrogenase family)